MVGKDTRRESTHAADDVHEAPTFAHGPGKRSLTSELEGANSPATNGPRVQVPPANLALFGGVPTPSASPSTSRPTTGGAIPRLEIGGNRQSSNAGGTQRAAAPKRVAEAETKGAPAVIKVVAYKGGKYVDTWSAKGEWEGPLPATYRGARTGGKWSWTADKGMATTFVQDVHIDVTKKNPTGSTVEQWAASKNADKIVVYARSPKDVAIDQEEAKDEHAPGTVAKDDAGDGASDKLKQSDAAAKDGKTETRGGKEGGKEGGKGDELGASKEEQKEVDEFERSIGLEGGSASDEGTTGDTTGGKKPGGKGTLGGDPEGRTGKDTELGGTGPGGDKARRDGDGGGSEDGGKGGSEGGSKDGKDGGDAGGMVGGEGKEGDDGVPSAMGLAGGLVGVPQAMKGFVELALILSEADFSGFGKKAFKEAAELAIKKGAKQAGETTATAIRSALASEARHEAAKATKKAAKKMATDKRTRKAWAKATKEEKAAFQRRVYYDHVNKFYQAAEDAAKKAKKQAEALLKKYPKNTTVQSQRRAAEAVEKATEVKPVAARLPRNHGYAGKAFPADQLPMKYRKKGLRFTDDGYPDFEPHAMQLKNGTKSVEIEYLGNRADDFKAANKAAGLKRTPDGYTWHHVEGGKKMTLVPDDLHDAVKHTGGVAHYKQATGVLNYD